tara:strand:+ start:193 stop:369 length:177 start_codon:yes stop_codon:yes gene_type:complete
MADFPNNPTDGETFTHPNGRTYTFDGSVWSIVRAGSSTFSALAQRVQQLEEISFLILE